MYIYTLVEVNYSAEGRKYDDTGITSARFATIGRNAMSQTMLRIAYNFRNVRKMCLKLQSV